MLAGLVPSQVWKLRARGAWYYCGLRYFFPPTLPRSAQSLQSPSFHSPPGQPLELTVSTVRAPGGRKGRALWPEPAAAETGLRALGRDPGSRLAPRGGDGQPGTALVASAGIVRVPRLFVWEPFMGVLFHHR